MNALDEDAVRRLAELARLALEPGEVTGLTQDLARILDHVETLAALPLDGVEPTTSASFGATRWRDDEPAPSLPRDEALAAAPRTDAGGFAVPGFVDEG